MARTSLRDHQSSRQPCPPRRAGVIGFISRHRVSVGTLAVVAIAIIAFVLIWFQPQKLFLNQTVNEAVPGAPAVAGTTPSLGTDGSTNHPPALGALPSGRPGQPGTAPGPTIVASGGFRSLEHATTGGAQILQLADGRRFLRLVDLHTSNGPELRVYLSEIPVASSTRTGVGSSTSVRSRATSEARTTRSPVGSIWPAIAAQ